MNSQTDAQLLRQYTEHSSEAAFAELVRRHVDFVYSAALRMVRNTTLAEDVTQSVFLVLAQNATQLTDRPILAGWLHRTTQNLAANAVRSDVRRRARESRWIGTTMNELPATTPDPDWEHIAPHLDAALGELSESDKEALLLRYCGRKSAHAIGQLLGISEDAAQKRVGRAVERLRQSFAKRGVTSGAGGLAVVIAANAVQAAPASLAVAISDAVATFSGTAVATIVTSTTTTQAIAMTTLQKVLIAVALVATVGAGSYQVRRVSEFENQIRTLQAQTTLLASENEEFRLQRDEATNRLAGLQLPWPKLESTNYAQYINKLKQAGCPESTIADLIIGGVNRLYASRIADLNRSFIHKPYWKARSFGDASSDPDYAVPFRNLIKEKDELIRQLVGVDLGKQSEELSGEANTLFDFDFLPETKRSQIEAMRQTSFDKLNAVIKRASEQLRPQDDMELKAIRASLDQDLKSALTETEYLDYQLRFSDTAHHLRRRTALFQPTESEFRALYDIEKRLDQIMQDTSLVGGDRANALLNPKAELKTLLGEKRYDDYLMFTSQEYERIATLGEKLNLPEETLRSVYDTKMELLNKRRGIVTDTTLDTETRTARIAELKTQALEKLRSVLDEESFAAYVRIDVTFNLRFP